MPGSNTYGLLSSQPQSSSGSEVSTDSSAGTSSKSSGNGLKGLLSVASTILAPVMGILNTGLGFLSSSIQNKRSVEQWNRENEYNKPVNQIQRLKEAGLNPALMYQNGASGLLSASSPTMQQSHQPSLVGVDPLTAAQIANINADTQEKRDRNARQNELQGFNIKNLVAQTNSLESESVFKRAQATLSGDLSNTERQRLRNLQQEWQQSNDSFQYRLEKMQGEARITRESALRTARQLEASIAAAEELSHYYSRTGQAAIINANAAAYNAETNALRLDFDKKKYEGYTDELGNRVAGESQAVQASAELQLAQLRREISEMIRNLQEADIFDETKFAKIVSAYVDIIK